MASGFSSSFRHYLIPGDDQVKSGVTSGMVVLDANVLLSAYRFAPAARGELLSALEKVGDRIWIPHRAAEEFHKNRIKVMSEYDEAYLPVMKALQSIQEELERDVRPKVAYLANRAALSDKERDELFDLAANSMKAATEKVEALRSAHGLGDSHGTDPILKRFQRMFNNRTGSAFNDEELKAALTEAEIRASSKLPPLCGGDADKSDPYGDYFIWKQILTEAARRKANFVIFVTSDTKEDWYLRMKGKTICARPELAQELMDQASAYLIMMSTSSFLFHAQKHLDVAVSPETIRQSKMLPTKESLSSSRSMSTASLQRRLLNERDHLEAQIQEVRISVAAYKRMENQATVADERLGYHRRRLMAQEDLQRLDSRLAGLLNQIESMEVMESNATGSISAKIIALQDDLQAVRHRSSILANLLAREEAARAIAETEGNNYDSLHLDSLKEEYVRNRERQMFLEARLIEQFDIQRSAQEAEANFEWTPRS